MEMPWPNYEELARICKQVPLTLGADPEFIISKNGQDMSAASVMPFGCQGFVGTDGCSSTAEIRPRPSNDPFLVVASCRSAISATKKLLQITDDKAKWAAHAGHVAFGHAIGGHIHLNFKGWNLSQHLPDTYLIQHMNQIFKVIRKELEDQEQAANRTARGYGCFDGDVLRGASHGGKEYRSPPSWLINPAVAGFYLTAGAMATYDAIMTHLHALKTVGQMDEPSFGNAFTTLTTRARPTVPATVTNMKWTLNKLKEAFNEPALHYPELIRTRMKQVAPVLDRGIDWETNILESWEV